MTRKDTIKNLRQELLEKRDDLSRILNGEVNALSGKQNRTVASDDISGAAQEAQCDEVNSQLMEASSQELVLIDDALTRFDSGTYGVCESCDSEIAIARLSALPYTSRCLKCQSKHEKRQQRYMDN